MLFQHRTYPVNCMYGIDSGFQLFEASIATDRGCRMPRIDAFLKIMQDVQASDLHIGAGSQPLLRINGVLEKTKHKTHSEEEVRILLYELLSDNQIEQLEKTGEIDLAYSIAGMARFRINMFKKYPGFAACFRMIPQDIPTLDSLGFPGVLKKSFHRKAV